MKRRGGNSLIAVLAGRVSIRSYSAMPDPLAALLQLSHDLGREDRPFAILGEGNTSAQLEGRRFAVPGREEDGEEEVEEEEEEEAEE